MSTPDYYCAGTNYKPNKIPKKAIMLRTSSQTVKNDSIFAAALSPQPPSAIAIRCVNILQPSAATTSAAVTRTNASSYMLDIPPPFA